jgi:hypothetical protein
MRKMICIVRHLKCIKRKARLGKDCQWHWQHILREFGAGKYAQGK